VFVLAHPSEETVRRDDMPRAGDPADYLREHFVIRAYSAAEEIVDAALTRNADLAETVERFFATDATAFLHVRFPTYGCFAMRIERPM